MRKFWILVSLVMILSLTGCGTEDAISITDYEWIYSHTRTTDGTVIYCNDLKQFPDAIPYSVTLTPIPLTPAAETARSLHGADLGYDILHVNQYTGEQILNIYGFTLIEANADTAVYSVNISGEPNDSGQAVVSKTVEGNIAAPTLILTTPNGTTTFLSNAVTITTD